MMLFKQGETYKVTENDETFIGVFYTKGHDFSPDGNGEEVYFFNVDWSVARHMVYPYDISKVEKL